MKVSELDSYTYAIDSSASNYSHLIFNYDDESSTSPATYRISIMGLGKAICTGLNLINFIPNDENQALILYQMMKIKP